MNRGENKVKEVREGERWREDGEREIDIESGERKRGRTSSMFTIC